jgi:hypothetical protein
MRCVGFAVGAFLTEYWRISSAFLHPLTPKVTATDNVKTHKDLKPKRTQDE